MGLALIPDVDEIIFTFFHSPSLTDSALGDLWVSVTFQAWHLAHILHWISLICHVLHYLLGLHHLMVYAPLFHCHENMATFKIY